MIGIRFLYLFSTILSLALYIYAPNGVDSVFQIICFLVFLVQAIFVLKDDIRKEGILNFNILFLFSFFMVTYAFPLFLIGVTMAQREGIEAFIDFNVSCKCSALCTLAISIYFLSYKRKRNTILDFSTIVKTGQLRWSNIIFIFLFVSLLYVTMDYVRNIGGISVSTGYWYALFLACLPIVLLYNTQRSRARSVFHFVKCNLHVLLCTILLMFLYFVIGDRGLVIICAIIICAVYHIMVKRIHPSLFLIGIIVGSMLMYAVRETRTTDSALSTGSTGSFVDDAGNSLEAASILTVFSDLTGIHRELYLGYKYVEINGLVEPAQIIIVPFYPLPLFPNMMSQMMFGKTMNEIKPGLLLNDYMAYSGHGHFGIHCVIDVYMRWGALGVIAAFYLWGYLVASIYASRKKNTLGIALYVMLLSCAISIPRQPILDLLRTFSYVIFIAWIASLFAKQRSTKLFKGK